MYVQTAETTHYDHPVPGSYTDRRLVVGPVTSDASDPLGLHRITRGRRHAQLKTCVPTGTRVDFLPWPVVL